MAIATTAAIKNSRLMPAAVHSQPQISGKVHRRYSSQPNRLRPQASQQKQQEERDEEGAPGDGIAPRDAFAFPAALAADFFVQVHHTVRCRITSSTNLEPKKASSRIAMPIRVRLIAPRPRQP